MGTSVNVAVILLRNRSTQAPPAMSDVQRYLRDDRNSVARFWADATYGWVSFPRMDFFGWFDVNLPDGTRRHETIAAGKAAAHDQGIDLRPYDKILTVVFGAGLDSGATGDRSGASINAPDPHHFVAHELGHVIGFDHTYGIPNAGSDWNGDDVVDLNPVYGDPYCIMSGMTFGGANPTFDLASKYGLPALNGLPNAWVAGPPPSRACLHFRMPLAAETAGRVRHLREANGEDRAVLNLSGGGSTGAEVVVFHPSAELGSGIGRVYVEYRWPDDAVAGTRWDAGLATTGGALDRAGLVVHVINPEPSNGSPIVWYVGRIVLPTTDLDVTFPTPTGPITVSVAESDVLGGGRPARLNVRFSRLATRSVNLVVNRTETRVVTQTEMRSHPSWPLFGPFTWEHREVTRTETLRPFVLGLGGTGPFEGVSPVQISWRVGGVALESQQGVASVPIPGRAVPVQIAYSIDPASRLLTVSNRPSDGTYDVPVQATATAKTDVGDVSASATYSAPGPEEGWGQDYYTFVDWWRRITNPIPVEEIPPRWWLQRRSDLAAQEIQVVAQVNPGLAQVMTAVNAEVARVSQR